MAEQATRLIDVEWGGEDQSNASFIAGVEVVAFDRSRLLMDVAVALSEHKINIVSSQTVTGSDRVAKMQFQFELFNLGQLDSVLQTIKGIESVYDAYRLNPGSAAATS
jgi:GTP pyrophosphokinase